MKPISDWFSVYYAHRANSNTGNVDPNLRPWKNSVYSSEMDPNTPSHTHPHTHTHQCSLAQVRSNGIMGNCSCGPSHLCHLRASQKHPRHLLLCSLPLPQLFLWFFCSSGFIIWAEIYIFTVENSSPIFDHLC